MDVGILLKDFWEDIKYCVVLFFNRNDFVR